MRSCIDFPITLIVKVLNNTPLDKGHKVLKKDPLDLQKSAKTLQNH